MSFGTKIKQSKKTHNEKNNTPVKKNYKKLICMANELSFCDNLHRLIKCVTVIWGKNKRILKENRKNN